MASPSVWLLIAGSPSRIASCKLRPGCCAFTRVVIFVGGACICLIAAGAHAQASPPLPKQRLLIEQPRLAEGRKRKRGVKGGKSGWMWLRGRRSRYWTFKEAMLLNVSQTMNRNITVQVWIILWNLGPREFGIALHQDYGCRCMYGITHELVLLFQLTPQPLSVLHFICQLNLFQWVCFNWHFNFLQCFSFNYNFSSFSYHFNCHFNFVQCFNFSTNYLCAIVSTVTLTSFSYKNKLFSLYVSTATSLSLNSNFKFF